MFESVEELEGMSKEDVIEAVNTRTSSSVFITEKHFPDFLSNIRLAFGIYTQRGLSAKCTYSV